MEIFQEPQVEIIKYVELVIKSEFCQFWDKLKNLRNNQINYQKRK